MNLRLKGMGCASCATTIERALQKVAGVEACSVNFALELASVTFDRQITNLNIRLSRTCDDKHGLLKQAS